jgi:hypothetical protein
MLAPVLGSLGRPYASRMQVICRHRFGAQLFHFILLRFRIGVESSETILLRRLILRLIKADQPVSFLATRTGPAPPTLRLLTGEVIICLCLNHRVEMCWDLPVRNFLVRWEASNLTQEKVQNAMVIF